MLLSAVSMFMGDEIPKILEENNTTAASIAIIDSDGSWYALEIGIADKSTGITGVHFF